ncbi:MAG: hypothetical protein IT384_19305 [Deltaproteobacteria bacterium]|nr:hypothetical protein [Deltaproteobacteria bacterium]
MAHSLRLAVLACLAITLAAPRLASATCASSGNGYGAIWVERTSPNCDCTFRAWRFSCLANGSGVHDRQGASPDTLATVSGDCNKDCEDLSGYWSAWATAMAAIPAGASSHACDTTFTDVDQDNWGVCLDLDEANPRVGVKQGVTPYETECDGVDNDGDLQTDEDGVDNDGDGPIDEADEACELDHKRLLAPSNLEGEGGDHVNLVEGSFIHQESADTMVAGPYAPLVLGWTYDSRRAADDANLGPGWTHSFAMFLRQQRASDGRWMVELGNGAREYFRCFSVGSDQSCAVDDHRPSGSLRRIGSTWYYFAHDGSRIEFDTASYSGKYPWRRRIDSSGFTLAYVSTLDGSGRPTKIETANSSIFLSLSYDTNGLDIVRVNSTSLKAILDFDFNTTGFKKLDRVKFAPTLGTIDANVFVAYGYNPDTRNLETIQQKIDASTTVTVGSVSYDASDRVDTIQTARMKLDLSWFDANRTHVLYQIDAGNTASAIFNHAGLWITSRSTPARLGSPVGRQEIHDDHGRLTCRKADDTTATVWDYTGSRMPVRVDFYQKIGGSSCGTAGTIDRKIWQSWEYNSSRLRWRPVWSRRKSIYNGASDCTGAGLPSGCSETKYSYVSTTDDRIQWVTRTGNTRLINDTKPQQIRKSRTFYYGLDTSVCPTANPYTGLPCRVEQQDGAGTVFSRTDFGFVASGATAGLPKTITTHDRSGDTAPL